MTASAPGSLPSATACECAVDSPVGDSNPLQPFQFRLRTLLGGMAVAGALFAVLSTIGPLWSAVVIWAVMLVTAHVAGNACGTKRNSAVSTGKASLLPANRVLFQIRATCLRERHGPGSSMLVGTVLGAAAGGLLGTMVLSGLYWEQFGAGPVGVGGASSAVVGGFVGYLAASFTGVASRAWQEASYELRRRR